MHLPFQTSVLVAALLWASMAQAAPPTEGQSQDSKAPEASRPSSAGNVVVALELSQQFYYEGDPLNVQLSVRNIGEKKTSNPVKTPLSSGFKVRRTGGEVLKPTGSPKTEEPARPEALAPTAFYGGVINLVDSYPELGSKGKYEIFWSADGLLTNMLIVTIIPRFDPTRHYSADILTDLGPIEIDLSASGAPIAVKAFVDMANAGLYDGLLFQEVQTDSYVGGGDPRFADPPRRAISFPAEPASRPVVAGTVVLRPVSAAPPANGPGFMIALKPQPAWAGQVTTLGQVIRGLDVVQKISRMPASPRNSQPPSKPLRDVLMRTVTIREKPAAGPS